VTVVCWSFNFTATRYALTHGFHPLTYSVLRFGTGAVIFAALTYARERSLRVRREDVWLLLGAAALGIWLNQVTFVYGVKLASAATVALVFGTLPIFVALVSWAFRLERLRMRHWIATVISFSGVGLVAAGTSGGLSGDLGGILIGLVQEFNEGLAWASPGGDWTRSIVFGILIAILVFRPSGLLGEQVPEGQ
jgi:drug/metabolite transporter (DMT)-like permease